MQSGSGAWTSSTDTVRNERWWSDPASEPVKPGHQYVALGVLYAAIAKEAMQYMDKFSTQSIANMAWAFATVSDGI